MRRRTFLRLASGAAGSMLVLPPLETFGEWVEASSGSVRPRRLLAISAALGFYPDTLFPAAGGSDFAMTRTLMPLAPLRDRFTLFGGTEHHPSLNGHPNEPSVFTGYSTPDSIRNGVYPISLDQVVAEQFGRHTPHRNIVLAASPKDNLTTSYYRGLPVYPTIDPRRLFDRLFGTVDTDAARDDISARRSVLDLSLAQAREMAARLSAADRLKLDEYFTSIREAEIQLSKELEWLDRPRPDVDGSFVDADNPAAGYTPETMLTRLRLLFDLVHLAFQYDLTRVISFHIRGLGSNHHGLTHHLERPATIESLIERDLAVIKEFARLMQKFATTETGGRSMMDDSLTILTTAMGDANAHSGQNLPSIVVGGGLKHRGFRSMPGVNQCDLYLALLHHLGIERDDFATSTGAIEL